MNTTRRDGWDALSLREKSEMMKVAVQNGIYNLDDIRKAYNEYAEGGPENNGNPKPITTGGAGYIPANYGQGMLDQLRENIYENIDPTENYPQSISELIDRMTGTSNTYPIKENPEIFKNKDMIWAQYLNIPVEKRHYKGELKESPYLPTKGSVKKAYELDLSDNEKERLIVEHFRAPMNGNINSDLLDSYFNTGTYTVGRGYDPKRGQYASFYDRWDINPFRGKNKMSYPIADFLGLDKLGDVSFGIGTPVEIYNRVYLDDYYNVPENKRGGYFLPEVTAFPEYTEEKALGGPLVETANRFAMGGPYKPGTYYGRPLEKGLEVVSPEFDVLMLGKTAANAAREAAGELINNGIQGTARQRAAITSRRFGRRMKESSQDFKDWSDILTNDVKTGNYADVPLDLRALAENVWETSRYIKNTPERYIENTLPRFYRGIFRRTYNNHMKPVVPVLFSDPEE